MDLNDLKNKINKNTRVIILTHYNGNSVNFSELKKLLKIKIYYYRGLHRFMDQSIKIIF